MSHSVKSDCKSRCWPLFFAGGLGQEKSSLLEIDRIDQFEP